MTKRIVTDTDEIWIKSSEDDERTDGGWGTQSRNLDLLLFTKSVNSDKTRRDMATMQMICAFGGKKGEKKLNEEEGHHPVMFNIDPFPSPTSHEICCSEQGSALA